MAKSRFGCGTVTRPLFVGWRNWTWLLFWLTLNQPSVDRCLMMSRLVIVYIIHTNTIQCHAGNVDRCVWDQTAAGHFG